MAAPRELFDVWFTAQNGVYRRVPFAVVTEWLVSGRVTLGDRLTPAGAEQWLLVRDLPRFAAYVPDLANADAPPEDEPEPEPEPAALPASGSDIAPPRPVERAERAIAADPEVRAEVEGDAEFPKPHPDEDDDVDMIPLIDISLVLLVFFIMTAKVAPVARVQVPDTQNIAQRSNAKGSYWIGVDLGPGNAPLYSLSKDGETPTSENDRLATEADLFKRFDEMMRRETRPVKVTVAGHQNVECDVIERISFQLETRKAKNVPIDTIQAEVNERAR